MRASAFFYGLAGLTLSVAIAEYVWGRVRGKDWHRTTDTVGNFNLAAGNTALSAVAVGVVLAGYHALWTLRPVTLSEHLPQWAMLLTGFLLAELCQYWNHRLSHRWNVLVWGHITHHTSSTLNLSTAVRVNWFYRLYAWLFYAPLALLGFTTAEFVAFQAVMNGYNMLMHTRLDIPMGPLKYLLVTPWAHRLHHSADPRHYGNYGASLILWDRLFGSYRELASDEDPQALRFGIGHNVDETDLVRLNFHYLQDLWATAKADNRSFWALLLSDERPSARSEPRARPAPSTARPALLYGVLAVVCALCIATQALGDAPLGWRLLAVAGAVGLSVAFGAAMQPWALREGSR